MAKSPDAFRTISEVADWLGVPTHVLRFWESRFSQVKPVKRAGGRRYYRPADMELIGGIKRLLHDDGMTIRGVQKLLREQGVKHVAALSQPLFDGEGEIIDANAEPVSETDGTVVAFGSSRGKAQDEAPTPAVSQTPAEPQPEEKTAAEEPASAPAPAATLAPVPEKTTPDTDTGGLMELMEETPSEADPETPQEDTQKTADQPESEAANADPEPAPPQPLGVGIADDPDDDALPVPAPGVAARLRLADPAQLAAHADTLALAHSRLIALRDRMNARR